MGYTWIEGCRRPRGVRDVRGGVSLPAIAKDRRTCKACAALARVLRSEMHGLDRFSRIDHLRTHKVKRVSVS